MNNYVNLDNFNIEPESKEIIQEINSLIESIKKIRENCIQNTQLNSITDPQDKNKFLYIIATIDFYIKILESELSKNSDNTNLKSILDEYNERKTKIINGEESVQNMINSITINITDDIIKNLKNLDIEDMNKLDSLDCEQNKYYCFIKDLYDRLITNDDTTNYNLIKYITQVYLKCTKKLLEEKVNQELEDYITSKKNKICSLPKNKNDQGYIQKIFSEEDENILD